MDKKLQKQLHDITETLKSCYYRFWRVRTCLQPGQWDTTATQLRNGHSHETMTI